MGAENRQLFILRRAFWFGRVNRNDVVRAFNVSPNLATNDLNRSVSHWVGLLTKEGRKGITRLPGPQIPPEAASNIMLRLFEANAEPWETGLFPEDLHVLAGAAHVFRGEGDHAEVITLACIRHTPLEILYVGLRKNESAKWRMVMPRALDFTGTQWRLAAHDLEAEELSLKIFAFSRIINVRNANSLNKNICVPMAATLEPTAYQVRLSPELTTDQIRSITREFGISERGTILLRKNQAFEFKRDFCTEKPEGMKDVVWPVFTDAKEVT